MKIVVDINHPSHVHYFKNFIWEMQKRGHEILITASEKDVSYRLLDAFGFTYIKLGNYGDSLLKKIINLPLLDFQMWRAVRKFDPDLLMGFGSIRAAHVSRFIGKPCIALDDTEHAVWEHRLYMPFTDIIITPACFQKDFGRKHVRYNGFTELAYLHPDYFTPDPKILKDIGITENDKIIIVRFIAWQAGHDLRQSGIKNKKKFVRELQKYGTVMISSESKLENELDNLRISLLPEQLHNLLYYATLYAGEGATTASECAVLGTHAFYLNTLRLGYLEEEEQKYGLVFNFNNKELMESAALAKAKELFKSSSIREQGKKKRENLIGENISLTKYLIQLIEKYPESLPKDKNEW